MQSQRKKRFPLGRGQLRSTRVIHGKTSVQSVHVPVDACLSMTTGMPPIILPTLCPRTLHGNKRQNPHSSHTWVCTTCYLIIGFAVAHVESRHVSKELARQTWPVWLTLAAWFYFGLWASAAHFAEVLSGSLCAWLVRQRRWARTVDKLSSSETFLFRSVGSSDAALSSAASEGARLFA